MADNNLETWCQICGIIIEPPQPWPAYCYNCKRLLEDIETESDDTLDNTPPTI